MRVEVPEQIPLRTYVQIMSDKIGVHASASVRHHCRIGGKYLIGLEFVVPEKDLADRLQKGSLQQGAPVS
jgi:hypothetical protein